MPRDLFGEVVHHTVAIGARKWYSVPLTIVFHAAIILAVIVVPLVATTEVGPMIRSAGVILEAEIKAPESPPGPPAARPAGVPRAPVANPNAAPVEAPTGIGPENGIVREPGVVDSGGVPGGLTGSVAGEVLILPERPAPPAPAAPVPVGGLIQPPKKTRDMVPAYPELARISRTQGIVILEAVISATGKVTDVRVLRSIPLLDQAAIDAVRQWEYTPTRLNGVAVPVVMTVTVTFQLQR